MHQFPTAQYSENASILFRVLVSILRSKPFITAALHLYCTRNCAGYWWRISRASSMQWWSYCRASIARRSRGVAVDRVETGDGSRLLSAQWSEKYTTLNAFLNQIIESTIRDEINFPQLEKKSGTLTLTRNKFHKTQGVLITDWMIIGAE